MRNQSKSLRLLGANAASLCAAALSVAAQTAEPNTPPETSASRRLTLEELLNVEVSTVSRNEQRLAETPASVAVLTGEDLRRSGVNDLAEALRLVPGVQVARLTSHQWAVSVRGFNEVFANKLLVMVDGRSVYTPLFSGTVWSSQDIPLENIERIEVVRGPGASMWGANAVNGVINIITRSARETQGGQLTVGGGNLDQFIGSFRYGMELSENAWLRFDGKYREHGGMEGLNGEPNGDDFRAGNGGFRLDWTPSESADFTLLGQGHYGRYNEPISLLDLSIPAFVNMTSVSVNSGGDLLGRWTRKLHEGSELEVQTYLDYSEIQSSWINDRRMTFDFELNHRWQLGERQEITWGVGYRLNADEVIATEDTVLFPVTERSVNIFSAYFQDSMTLLPDELTAIAGVRLEHNDYTGFEAQPTLRAFWQLAEEHAVWTAASGAVRTPSRADNDAIVALDLLPPGTAHPVLPVLTRFYGSTAFESEKLWAFELGYRWHPIARFNFDLTGYYNLYDQLRGTSQGTPFPNNPLAPTYLVMPLQAVNDTSGNSYGAELTAAWQATERWRWRLGYSVLALDLDGSDAASLEGAIPHHQFTLRSLLQVSATVELDATLRYVDELPGTRVPAYLTADVRLGWKPCASVELSIIGQNLLDSPHQEFSTSTIRYQPAAITRAVYGQLTWSF